MAIEKRTSLYELLVRFNGPSVTGVHIIDLEEIVDTDTGEVLNAKPGLPKPLDPAEVGEVLGKALEPMQHLYDLIAERDDARARHNEAMGKFRQAMDQNARLSAMLDKMQPK